MFAFGFTNVYKTQFFKHELNVVHLELMMMAFKIASVDIASRHNIAPKIVELLSHCNIAPKTVEIPSHPLDFPAHVHAPNIFRSNP
jgi:hypothetical protein